MMHLLADPPTREQGWALIALAITGPPSLAWFSVVFLKELFR